MRGIKLVNRYGRELALPFFEVDGFSDSTTLALNKINGRDGEEIDEENATLSAKNLLATGLLWGKTREDAEKQRKEITAFLNQKGLFRLYINDTEYYLVKKQSIAHQFIEETGGVCAEVTINFIAPEPFLRGEKLEIEASILPGGIPLKVEVENPDPLINLTFGHYDVSTGAKINEQNYWTIGTTVTGYSGTGYAFTGTVGNGFQFTCAVGFAIAIYSLPGRKVKIFIDGVYADEIFYNGSGSWELIVQKQFKDRKLHNITIVNSSGALAVDYILVGPTNQQIISYTGTADTFPVIEITSIPTKRTYTTLGKTTGDLNHPITIRASTNNNINVVTPTSAGEINNTNYTYAALLGGYSNIPVTTTNGYFPYLTIELSLSAKRAGFSGIVLSDIISKMQNITYRIWAYGEGPANGVLSYGAELYVRRMDNNSWEFVGSNTANTPTLIEWSISGNYQNYVDASGKLCFLVKSLFPSNGQITSKVYMDYCLFETVNSMAILSNRAITNSSQNLLPPFNSIEWTIHSNARIRDNYLLELEPEGATYASSFIGLPVIPNATYMVSGKWCGYVNIYKNDNMGISIMNIPEVDRYSATIQQKSFSFVTPPDTHTIFLRCGNEAKTHFCSWENLVLLPADSIPAFNPQTKRVIGFTPDVTIVKGERLIIDPGKFQVDKNGVAVTTTADFDFEPLKLTSGVNYLTLSHSGSILNYKISFNPKSY